MSTMLELLSGCRRFVLGFDLLLSLCLELCVKLSPWYFACRLALDLLAILNSLRLG